MLLTLAFLLFQPFDYYVLSLSWSPEHCSTAAGKGDSQQCGSGRRFGFVVHGLWPQYERGYPQNCGPAAPLSQPLVSEMLPIMPSTRLIRHEWEKHGACSGLPAAEYFQKVRAAFQAVKIPADYQTPGAPVYVAPAELKKKFLQANTSRTDRSVAVLCRGRYLQEVRVCFTKDLKPRDCGTDVRDRCKAPEIILRPVR